ncbi:MAG TPA: phage head closure protein [Denitromonas sp.]|nr:phage head closure protein [Denitromonas sp.]
MAKTTPIQLQSASIARSATGQETKTWSTYATVYGKVVTLRGQAYYAAQQTANETVSEVYIHHRTDVDPEDRAIMGGVTYELATPAVNVGMKNRELLLRLREVK